LRAPALGPSSNGGRSNQLYESVHITSGNIAQPRQPPPHNFASVTPCAVKKSHPAAVQFAGFFADGQAIPCATKTAHSKQLRSIYLRLR
jgi:hypothetical protein